MRPFPTSKYKRQTLTFYPAPFRAPLRAFAVLVFPWRAGEVLICDITDRGWCVPSGRVEPNESSGEAGRREAIEEGGAVLGDLHYIGCYQIQERQETRWADCYTAEVLDLVEIQTRNESRGRRFVEPSDLPRLYHLWSPLTEQVFEHAHQIWQRSQEHRAG